MVHADRRRREVAAITAIGVGWGNGSAREGGSRLAASPALQAAPVSTVARAMLQRALPGVSGALSAQRQAQLEAAARRIDHYGGPGAWIAYAEAVIGGWERGELGDWTTEPPRSLGALAIELRREANCRRYGALARRRERLRPLAASSERQKSKWWRRGVREQERIYPGAGRNLRRPRDLP